MGTTSRTTSHVTSKTTSRSTTTSFTTSFNTSRSTTTTFGTSRTTATTLAGPLPASGVITLSQIRDVFFMTGSVSLTDFYGVGDPALPASGTISMSDFYGVRNYRNTTTSFNTSRSTTTVFGTSRGTSRLTTTSYTTSWTTSYTTSYYTDTFVASCFPAETPVWMADGTRKPICDVRVGDRLDNGYGGIVEVLAFDRPHLGQRPIYRINKDFYNTPEHLTWTREGWAVIDKEQYMVAEYDELHPVSDGEGNEWEMTYVGVVPEKVVEYTEGSEIGYRGGYKKIESLEKHYWNPDVLLYALVTTGSRTFMVGDGYVVSGWANDQEYDYTNFGKPLTLWQRLKQKVRRLFKK